MSARRTILWLLLLAVISTPGAAVESIEDARRDIRGERYDRAHERLVEIARNANGQGKQEALYLLAGLKSSVSEAEIIYQEVVRIDSDSDWGDRAAVEIAKIHYAIGDYGRALTTLREAAACRRSEEACYFQGLSALMLERYADAKAPLSRVHSGKYRPWAYLALAEVDMNLDAEDTACDRYHSMARAAINPTAMYRYAECIEKRGDRRNAREAFEDVIREFPSTPESVLAEQKLAAIGDRRTAQPEAPPADAEPEEKALEQGFTLQFGAFQDRANAIRLAAQLKRHIKGVRIDSDLVNHREIHRVRFGYYATREEAQANADRIGREFNEPVTIMILP